MADQVHIDVDALVRETDAAWLFAIDGAEVWLPKSQCDWDEVGTVTVPLWLAERKELV